MAQDYVVVFWDAVHGFGVARTPESCNRGDGIKFLKAHILTYGIESLRRGTMIRGEAVDDPRNPGEMLIIDIEIYLKSAQAPDPDFASIMNGSRIKTKVY